MLLIEAMSSFTFKQSFTLLLLASVSFFNASGNPQTNLKNMTKSSESSPEIASFGAGCFWCVEAVFENLDGVHSVESGYMGGSLENPTYKDVCSGVTGHAEIVQIAFDPEIISYETLLDWLWRSHDPTTLNRQGADTGTQYRSAIFYHSEDQRITAEASKAAAQKDFKDPIVTEITAASTVPVRSTSWRSALIYHTSTPLHAPKTPDFNTVTLAPS